MISFRYHLVSLIGIFLAIALGVVVGAGALNGAVVGDLRRQVSDLKKSGADADARNRTLQSQAANADLLAQAYGPKIVGPKLAHTKVVLVGAPGASKTLKDAVTTQIQMAGGQVSARIQLTPDFDNPDRANDIRSLATSAHPIGLQLPTGTDDPGTLAGALLGYVLLGHGQSSDLTQVLAGFGTLNMVKSELGAPSAGKVVVMVAPGALAKGNSGGAMLLSFSTELGTTGATLVAGDPAADTAGGLVALIRADAAAKKAVSTLDDVSSPLGQLSVVLAAADAIAGHRGHFGSGNGADALLPGVSS